jgi:hypothetical protein
MQVSLQLRNSSAIPYLRDLCCSKQNNQVLCCLSERYNTILTQKCKFILSFHLIAKLNLRKCWTSATENAYSLLLLQWDETMSLWNCSANGPAVHLPDDTCNSS